jgi:hypothetical protein
MYEYTIYVTFQGMKYQTKIITDKNATEEEIYQLAKEQVEKQWCN